MFQATSYALILDFTDLNIQTMEDYFSEVHFMAPGNDFGGAIFWFPPFGLSLQQEIEINSESTNCSNLIRGLYYNNARGQRLWPLDNFSLASLQNVNSWYLNLSLSGWLFTTCDVIPNIVGQLTHNWSGTIYNLLGGVEMDYRGNSYTWSFANNLQYFDNVYPLWYLFDSAGGLGFVGWILTGHDCLVCMSNGNCTDPACTTNCTGDSINELFVYDEENSIVAQSGCNFGFGIGGTGQTYNLLGILSNIIVKWTIGISKSTSQKQRQSILGTLWEKTTLFNAPNLTSSTLMNQVKKTAQNLCKWRQNYAGTSYLGNTDPVVCFLFDEYNISNEVTIDLLNDTEFIGKIIVIKNGNLVFQNSMTDMDPPLEISVTNGNLYLDNTPGMNLQNFDSEGYLASTGIVAQWMYLKGTFIINGLILGRNGSTSTWFEHKLYLHGKVYSLNSPSAPAEWRITQIETLFQTNSYEDLISLQNVFSWYCNPLTGSGSDGIDCSEDQYAGSPLIIIEHDFDAGLLDF